MNQVVAYALCAGEVTLLFYVGEMIGRGSIIGYNPVVEEE